MGKTERKTETAAEAQAFNPLRNERIKVEFVPRKVKEAPDDPKHIAYGGLMRGATISLSVPMQRNGRHVNVLTNDEKRYLEDALGLGEDGLSVYRKDDENYWNNLFIPITKEGVTLDLSDPEDYIKWKVLLANSDIVAPSRKELQDRPKATYRFVLAKENEDVSMENAKMDAIRNSYKEFDKIEDDVDTMRVLVELLDGKPYDQRTKKDFLRSRINLLIQANPKRFLDHVRDPMLHTKMLIRRSVELGKLSKRGDYYYLRSDGSPLGEAGEDPTLSVAARFLNMPSHQDIKFLLESELDKAGKQ